MTDITDDPQLLTAEQIYDLAKPCLDDWARENKVHVPFELINNFFRQIEAAAFARGVEAMQRKIELPDEVVKDAELIAKLKECRRSVKSDYKQWNRFVMRKKQAGTLNQNERNELTRICKLLDYIDTLPDAAMPKEKK